MAGALHFHIKKWSLVLVPATFMCQAIMLHACSSHPNIINLQAASLEVGKP